VQVVGDRGERAQATMHAYHPGTNVIFYAEVGRDAVTCWNAGQVMQSTNIGVLARDPQKMSYPAGKEPRVKEHCSPFMSAVNNLLRHEFEEKGRCYSFVLCQSGV
jgi:hypothetical protein